MATSQAIEVVQNLVLDTIEPFVRRLRDLEETVLDLATTPMPARETLDKEPGLIAEVVDVAQGPLQARLDAIIEMHRLDAVPALWQFVAGKREQAPEGLWEITCSVCKDYTLTWREGQPPAAPCKTVRLARGE